MQAWLRVKQTLYLASKQEKMIMMKTGGAEVAEEAVEVEEEVAMTEEAMMEATKDKEEEEKETESRGTSSSAINKKTSLHF